MATLSIEVPNPVAVRVVNAIAALHGYQSTVDIGNTVDAEGNHIPNIVPNPMSKQEFTRQYVITVLRNQVIQYEADVAAQAARLAAETTSNSEIILT